MNLYSAVFYTQNIQQVEDFYHLLLGLKIERRADDAFISFIFDNGVRLGIKKSVEEREVPGRQTIFIEVDDINKTYDQIKLLNIKIRKEITHDAWADNFSILDPDGNKIQFVKPNISPDKV